MRIFIEALRLEDNCGCLVAPDVTRCEDDESVEPIALAAVLASGAQTWEGPEVAVDEKIESQGISLLHDRASFSAQADAHLTVSIFAKIKERHADCAKLRLVADVLVSAKIVRPSLRTSSVELEWNANRRVWVGDLGACIDEGVRPAVLSPKGKQQRPILTFTHRSDLLDPLPGAPQHARISSDDSALQCEAAGSFVVDEGETIYPQLSRHASLPSVTALTPDATLARLVVPGFDPRGWLKSSAMPPGIGEHTVMEVLNLFLDGVAAQLGINTLDVSGESKEGDDGPEPEVETAGEPSVLLAQTSNIAGKESEHSRGQRSPQREMQIGPSIAQLERETSELRLALAEQGDTADRRGRRCEELQRRFEIAERETVELRSQVSSYKKQLAWSEGEFEKLRQTHKESEQLHHRQREEASRALAINGEMEVLYCVRTALRQVLLSGWIQAPVALACADVGELIHALRQHMEWLWRSLRYFWDLGPLLKDALDEAQRTPRAVASLAASGEPPWPEAAMAPRAREAQQLLEFLTHKVASLHQAPPQQSPEEQKMDSGGPIPVTATSRKSDGRGSSGPTRTKPTRLARKAAGSSTSAPSTKQSPEGRSMVEITSTQDMPLPCEADVSEELAVTTENPNIIQAKLPEQTANGQVAIGQKLEPSATEPSNLCPEEIPKQTHSQQQLVHDGPVHSISASSPQPKVCDEGVQTDSQQKLACETIWDLDVRPLATSKVSTFKPSRRAAPSKLNSGLHAREPSRPSELNSVTLEQEQEPSRDRASITPDTWALIMAETWMSEQDPPRPVSTQTLAYPCGVSLQLFEYASILSPLAAANKHHRTRLLRSIESRGFVSSLLGIYVAHDVQARGFLEWTHYEMHDFIVDVFRKNELSPPSEGQTYRFFAKFDITRCMALEARECLCLVDAMLRATFIRPPRRSINPAELWVADVDTWQPTSASTMRYPCGVDLDFAQFTVGVALGEFPKPSASTASKLDDAFRTGTLVRSLLQVYRACDRDNQGFLLWEENEITDFVQAVFEQYTLHAPTHVQVRRLYESFTDESDNCLNARECISLADALLRATLCFHSDVLCSVQVPSTQSVAVEELSPPRSVPHGSICDEESMKLRDQSVQSDDHTNVDEKEISSTVISARDQGGKDGEQDLEFVAGVAEGVGIDHDVQISEPVVPMLHLSTTNVDTASGAPPSGLTSASRKVEAARLRRELAVRDVQIQELERRLQTHASENVPSAPATHRGDDILGPAAFVRPPMPAPVMLGITDVGAMRSARANEPRLIGSASLSPQQSLGCFRGHSPTRSGSAPTLQGGFTNVGFSTPPVSSSQSPPLPWNDHTHQSTHVEALACHPHPPQSRNVTSATFGGSYIRSSSRSLTSVEPVAIVPHASGATFKATPIPPNCMATSPRTTAARSLYVQPRNCLRWAAENQSLSPAPPSCRNTRFIGPADNSAISFACPARLLHGNNAAALHSASATANCSG